jgi:hypothetical protein
VTAFHRPDKVEFLTAKKGDCLRFERLPSQYQGWIWCRSDTGQTGWVPEAWVRIENDICFLLQDYDARELTVRPDDILTCILIESGWLLAVSDILETGWVPLECLDPGWYGNR